MKRINTPEEFKEFYPYKSPPNKAPCPAPEDYPKRYPCVDNIEKCDGCGICVPLCCGNCIELK